MSRYAGMLDEFSVLAYGQKNPATVQFMQNRYSEFQGMGHMLTDYGKSFVENSKKVFEYVTGSDAMSFSQAVLRKVENMFQRNEYRELHSVHDIQQSPQIMHRGLMTLIDLRTLYLDQRVCGFDETYLNVDGNTVGADQRDYRLFNHGLLRDDEEHGWRQSYYSDAMEELDAVDRVIPDMKFTIQSAGHYVTHALKQENGPDPSSPDGNKL